jgi:hypothetical protein
MDSARSTLVPLRVRSESERAKPRSEKGRDRLLNFNIDVPNSDLVCIEEVLRLGVLKDGIQLTTTDIKFPILGQVIPRIPSVSEKLSPLPSR